jgi:hypothetical protein
VLALLMVGGLIYGASLLREARGNVPAGETSAAAETAAPAYLMPEPLEQAAKRMRAGYHYKQLTPGERTAYRAIYEALPAWPGAVDVSGLDSDGMSRVFQALTLDQPLLFQISSTHYKTRTVNDTEVTGFLPEYRMEPAEYQRQLEALYAVCRSYLQTSGGDDYLAELALHDQLVRECNYTEDISLAENNTAYGALVKRQAACEGYSKAMLLLLELRGIEAGIVTGDANNAAGVSGGHAWNKVKINGNWYHLDATWDDPVSETGSNSISHAYFNLTDDEIGQSHELSDPGVSCTATADNYFKREGLEFTRLERADETVLAQRMTEALSRGGNCLEFRCSSGQALQQAQEYLFDPSSQRVYRIIALANSSAENAFKTDMVYHAELTELRVIRVFPVKK